jgi:hypothetical protein
MSSTARRTWQLFESRVAVFFGCRRAVLSGSSGRDDTTASDSTHPSLFLECKLRATHTARTLHDETKRLAAKERKTPVLALADKNRPGFLICVHSDDWPSVVAEWAAGLPPEQADALEGAMRRAYARRHEGE